jgi:hypothetical protein
MPCRWAEAGLTEFAGRVRLRRRFGYPGTIDACERVWLTFGGCEGHGEVSLNGTVLGVVEGEGGAEFEVTSLLQSRNDLAVDLEGPEQGGLWGEVALEVRRTAYLRGVRLWREGTVVRATGEVVGSVTGLELYLIVGRRTVAYRELKADGGIGRNDTTPVRTPPGLPFELSGAAEEGEAGEAGKVDLVGGAVVWYTVELLPLAEAEAGSDEVRAGSGAERRREPERSEATARTEERPPEPERAK